MGKAVFVIQVTRFLLSGSEGAAAAPVGGGDMDCCHIVGGQCRLLTTQESLHNAQYMHSIT